MDSILATLTCKYNLPKSNRDFSKYLNVKFKLWDSGVVFSDRQSLRRASGKLHATVHSKVVNGKVECTVNDISFTIPVTLAASLLQRIEDANLSLQEKRDLIESSLLSRYDLLLAFTVWMLLAAYFSQDLDFSYRQLIRLDVLANDQYDKSPGPLLSILLGGAWYSILYGSSVSEELMAKLAEFI